jgi:FkbM family methyltransferase
MLRRLVQLTRYNRDWPRYIWSKYQPPQGHDLLTFRLRNGQTVTTRADARFILNEIFLDRVYDVLSRAPEAIVYCFEPSAQNFALLQRNIHQNNAPAKAFKLAVGASNTMAFLSLAGASVEYSLSEAGPATEQVECVDLWRVFELTGVDTFDFVKIDIEGAERELLSASSDDLLKRMNALSLEWHHSWKELEALAERFRAVGFRAEPVRLHGHILYLRAARRRNKEAVK